jgi:hypothetical protein
MIDGEIEGGIYVQGGAIEIQDAIVLKGCTRFLLLKGKR